MDRITRYARPHCYDASRVPLSFLDNGQRSRSSPRINVDPITRKACPERQPSDSSSTTGIAGSRLRAQSTDSLTWRRAVALKSRQHVIASRQHQSHAELRTDSSECLFGTVVVDFSDNQIGEQPVFDCPKPLECSTPVKPLTNGASKLYSIDSTNCDIIRRKDRDIEHDNEKTDSSESRIRPVVETVAVHGRRLSYSKAAGADRLDSSDLDELARQIGLLHDDSSTSSKPSKASSKSQTILNKSIESLKNCQLEMDVIDQNDGTVSTTKTATTEPQSQNKEPTESRSRKGKMGWLGGLFRRLRHWPESSTTGGESKKQRRRARSLPPASKGRSNQSPAPEHQPPSGTESPVAKKSSLRGLISAKSSFKKHESNEKLVTGVSRSRTVDDIERARAHDNDELDLVLPKLNTTRISESEFALNTDLNEDQSSKNGHCEQVKKEVQENQKSFSNSKSSQPPSYCNLAILAYGYSVAYPGLDIHESKKSNVVKELHLVNASEVNQIDDVSEKPIVQLLSDSSSEKKESPNDIVEPIEKIGQSLNDTSEICSDSERLISDRNEVKIDSEKTEAGNLEPSADTKVLVVANDSLVSEHQDDGDKETYKPIIEENDDSDYPNSINKSIDISDGSLTANEKQVILDNCCKPESVESGVTKQTARVTISSDVNVVVLNDTKEEKSETEQEFSPSRSPRKGRESPSVVVRRKKTVSCSEAPDSIPRSSLIMLAVSQASPRPKTEMIDAALMKNTRLNPMSVSQHEDIIPTGSEEKDGFYFLRLASEVEADFRGKMDIVEKDLVTNSDMMSDEVSGILRSLVGKANLLLTDKFSQLRGLCQQNISEQVDPSKQRSSLLEGFATRNSDLDGYWALVQLQIDDVQAQFSRVDKLRKDDWQMPSTVSNPSQPKSSSRPGPVKRKKKTPSTTNGSKSNRSAVSQARLEARKRLENAKREAASKMNAAAAQNTSDGDVFIFV